MEKSLWTVGLGTITISTTSAFVTGLYGIVRNTPRLGILVGTAAINSGITAGTFFSIREFGISPVLIHVAPWKQYEHRRRELGIGNDAPTSEKISWSDLRTDKLFDSGVAGSITGGLLRGLKTGRHAIVSGAVTASAACIVLQYACNELGIARLRYISKLQEENKSLTTQPSFNLQNGKQVYEAPGSVFEQLLKAVGVIPISDEEYLVKLKRTRDVYLKRMVDLENQVEEEKNTKMPRS